MGVVHAPRTTVKRGQVTIFIIVGLVLVIVVGFAVFIMNLLNTDEPDLGVDPSDDSRGCLERVSRHVLLTTAAGGAEPPLYVLGTTHAPPNTFFDEYNERALTDLEYQQHKDWLRFGINRFAPLCIRAGPNRPNASGDGWSSCMSGTYNVFTPDETTIQHAVRQRIDAELRTANCGAQPPSTVLFGADEVAVYTQNNTATIPIRFKALHNAAVRVALAEINAIDYNTTNQDSIPGCDEPLHGNQCILPGMRISFEHGTTHHNITVIDTQYLINNQQPVYRFAIENRLPLITTYPNTGAANGYGHTQSTVQSTLPPLPQTIPVTARDPDEQALDVECYWLDGTQRRDIPERSAPHTIPIKCDMTGITITPPACMDEYTFAHDIFYEACDLETCANSTIPAPRILSDDLTAPRCD